MRTKIKSFFQSSQNEIESDRVLSLFGMILCCLHLVAFVFRSHLPQVMSQPYQINCWPFFQNCSILQTDSTSVWYFVVFVYVFIAVLGALMFYAKKIRKAYWLLAAATVISFSINSLRYQFMGNYHWIHLMTCASFLLVPGKRQICQVLPVLFYLSAGTLKLNPEWLGGYAIGKLLPWGGWELLILGCYYVVVLELIFVFGLFSRVNWIKWSVLGQFILFHLMSYYWVGYFYPAVMLGVLSIFPLIWIQDQKSSSFRFQFNRVQTGLLALLILGQLWPHFIYEDPAKVGTQRLTSLNMFDARLDCVSSFLLRSKNKNVEFEIENFHHGVRVACDPVLFLSQARMLCKEAQTDSSFIELDLHLLSRRASEPHYQLVLKKANFCGSD